MYDAYILKSVGGRRSGLIKYKFREDGENAIESFDGRLLWEKLQVSIGQNSQRRPYVRT